MTIVRWAMRLEDVGAVADDEKRRAVPFVEPTDQVEDVVAHVRVERRGGFIGDDERGAAHDRLGNENPLALTAAQLVRIGVVDPLRVLGQADLVHRGERPLAYLRRSHRVWARTTSPICAPTVRTGLSARADSWKTMPISAASESPHARARGSVARSRPLEADRAGHRRVVGQ